MRKNLKKYRLVILIIVILVVIGYFVLIPYFKLGGQFDNKYTGQDLDENFNVKQSEIFELRDYFIKMLPEGIGLSFGFDGRSNRYYFIIREIQQDGSIGLTSGERLGINNNHIDNLLVNFNWDKNQLKTLIEKLEAANCIGVFKQPYKNYPVQISFREGGTNGLAHYSYYLFSEPFNDSLIKAWNEKEGITSKNDSVFFEFGYPL